MAGIVVAFFACSRLGPPAMPVFLNGLVCLGGHMLMLGALITAITALVKS